MKSLFHKVKDRSKLYSNIPKFVCLIGIDGAGKTTLAKGLINSFASRSIKYYYLWGGIDKLIFISPLQFIFYRTFLTKKEKDIEAKKNNLRVKHPKLTRIYYFLMKIDYLLGLLIGMLFFKLLRRRIICDRYIFDVGINIALAQNMPKASIYSFIKNCFKFLPKPDILIWLDVPVKTAMSRKNDIFSERDLVKRKEIYKEIAKKYNAVRFDGIKPTKELESEVLEYLLSFQK